MALAHSDFACPGLRLNVTEESEVQRQSVLKHYRKLLVPDRTLRVWAFAQFISACDSRLKCRNRRCVVLVCRWMLSIVTSPRQGVFESTAARYGIVASAIAAIYVELDEVRALVKLEEDWQVAELVDNSKIAFERRA